jgi:hypothetical protein
MMRKRTQCHFAHQIKDLLGQERFAHLPVRLGNYSNRENHMISMPSFFSARVDDLAAILDASELPAVLRERGVRDWRLVLRVDR